MQAHPIIWLVVALCAMNVVYALRTGVAYPFGPIWFPVARARAPLGFWATIVMFVLLGGFFVAVGWLGFGAAPSQGAV